MNTSSVKAPLGNARGSHSLTSVVYSVFAAIVVSGAFRWFLGRSLERFPENGRLAVLTFPAILFGSFTVWTALAVVQGYAYPSFGPRDRVLVNIRSGLVAGVFVSLAALPALFGKGDFRTEAIVTSMAMRMAPVGILGFALLIAGLPVVGELVFRGIVLDALKDHVSFPAAVLISCLLFTYFWPAFSPPGRIVLSIVSALAYRRSGSLIPSVVANATFALASCMAVAWHGIR